MKKLNKKVSISAVVLLCALCVAVGGCAATVVQNIQAELRPDFTVVIDGTERTFKNVNGEVVDPILYNGSTYLPIRAIGEIMGKKVTWYEDQKRIELTDESSTVTDADQIVTDTTTPAPQNNGASSAQQNTAPQGQNNGNNQGSVPATAGITVERAKEIALERAGLAASDVTFTEARRDYDDRVEVYDIEFRRGRTEYSAEIRVSDGAIVSWEVDND